MPQEIAERPSQPRPAHGGADPTLSSYLRDISTSTPLTTTQEIHLTRRSRAGDTRARNELVEANLRFVVAIAKEYQRRGLPLVELIGAGNVGLITAAERFDETRGFRFISYAVWWIRQSILQALSEQSTVRLPTSRRDLMRKISRALREQQQDGRPPSLEAVAKTVGCPVQKVERAFVGTQMVCSLDAQVENNDERSFVDLLVQDGQPEAEHELFDHAMAEDIAEALTALTTREAKVLRLYYGIGGGSTHTLDQIGSHFGLTRERVRQIKKAALGKLRRSRYQNRLRPWTQS